LQGPNGYIYTIFSLEVSHPSLSPSKLSIKACPGPGSRLASEDHWLDLAFPKKKNYGKTLTRVSKAVSVVC
jgi:hypothetical protein